MCLPAKRRMSRWGGCPRCSRWNPAGRVASEEVAAKIRAVDLDSHIRRPLPYPTCRLGLAAARPRTLADPFP